ncbi:MAG TPA: hypothetical protein VFG10_17625 [Saprospiraceae bacterium]|nr:hypothetical protein [Saprospiraceae bacterium]
MNTEVTSNEDLAPREEAKRSHKPRYKYLPGTIGNEVINQLEKKGLRNEQIHSLFVTMEEYSSDKLGRNKQSAFDDLMKIFLKDENKESIPDSMSDLKINLIRTLCFAFELKWENFNITKWKLDPPLIDGIDIRPMVRNPIRKLVLLDRKKVFINEEDAKHYHVQSGQTTEISFADRYQIALKPYIEKVKEFLWIHQYHSYGDKYATGEHLELYADAHRKLFIAIEERLRSSAPIDYRRIIALPLGNATNQLSSGIITGITLAIIQMPITAFEHMCRCLFDKQLKNKSKFAISLIPMRPYNYGLSESHLFSEYYSYNQLNGNLVPDILFIEESTKETKNELLKLRNIYLEELDDLSKPNKRFYEGDLKIHINDAINFLRDQRFQLKNFDPENYFGHKKMSPREIKIKQEQLEALNDYQRNIMAAKLRYYRQMLKTYNPS